MDGPMFKTLTSLCPHPLHLNCPACRIPHLYNHDASFTIWTPCDLLLPYHTVKRLQCLLLWNYWLYSEETFFWQHQKAEVHMRLNSHVLEFFFSSCPQYELHTCPVQHAYWWIHGYYINAHRIMPETYCAWSCKMEIITVQFSTVRNKTCMAEFHFVIMGNYTKQSCLKTQNRHLKDALGNDMHKVR